MKPIKQHALAFGNSVFASTSAFKVSLGAWGETGYCDRMSKITFRMGINAFSDGFFKEFNCRTCDERNLCGKRSHRRVEFIDCPGGTKKGIFLFQETGVTSQTTIGRFTFKIKGEEDGKECADKIEQQG